MWPFKNDHVWQKVIFGLVWGFAVCWFFIEEEGEFGFRVSNEQQEIIYLYVDSFFKEQITCWGFKVNDNKESSKVRLQRVIGSQVLRKYRFEKFEIENKKEVLFWFRSSFKPNIHHRLTCIFIIKDFINIRVIGVLFILFYMQTNEILQSGV